MAHGSSGERATMPLGLAGVGEAGITGAAAAVASGTGRRIRDLPVALDKRL
jgi:CO/xanthine dehydrogenase Mo-binding subunit